LLRSRKVENPIFKNANIRSPVIIQVDASGKDIFGKELFGPIAVLIKTKNTDESISLAKELADDQGSICCSAYTTDAKVKQKITTEMLGAGTPVSFNLTGGTFVNQNAAFSDFHVSGSNPSGNGSFTNPEFVIKRFFWAGTREPSKWIL
jgi:acyl-CoA reductase-like NAD-dependent aldehyde dehydrogenase